MALEQLNQFLKDHKEYLKAQPPLFVFMTGASGAWKTSIARALEKELDPTYVRIEYFDAIGVPSVEDMIREFGSAEKWQEAATHTWIERLKDEIDKKVIILEGQFNPQFAIDACRKYGIQHFIFFGIHAERLVREQRLLHLRKQPELVNDDMNNWAEYLKRKTIEVGGTVIDTSASTLPVCINLITELIKEELTKKLLMSR